MSSFIVLPLVGARREEVARDATQDHSLQAVEVEEAVGLGGAGGIDDRAAGVVAQQTLETAHGDGALAEILGLPVRPDEPCPSSRNRRIAARVA